jgi:hypothetical protein
MVLVSSNAISDDSVYGGEGDQSTPAVFKVDVTLLRATYARLGAITCTA